MRVAVIGTGAMGKPIALNCLAAGHSLVVYNRTRERAEELRAFGAELAETLAQTNGCDVVITALADDLALQDVVFNSEKFFTSMVGGTTHICVSTISVNMAKRLAAAHADLGQRFMATPIMGRPEMAASREISILAAGARSTYERCLPVLESISRNVRLVSEVPWHATLLKLCANFLLLSAVETLAEGLSALPAGGIAPSLFLEVMNDTLFKVPFYPVCELLQNRLGTAGVRKARCRRTYLVDAAGRPDMWGARGVKIHQRIQLLAASSALAASLCVSIEDAATVSEQVRAYRGSHEKQILDEFCAAGRAARCHKYREHRSQCDGNPRAS